MPDNNNKEKMRFMERIRRQGAGVLIAFLVIFVVSLFFGLTIGGNNNAGGGGVQQDPRLTEQERQAGRIPTLVKTDEMALTALKVNGEPVSNKLFYETVTRIVSFMGQDSNDPETLLSAYGYAANALVEQQIWLAKAAEFGVEVLPKDIEAKKVELTASYLQAESKAKGNVVLDAFKGLSDRKARKAAFLQYLQQTGLTTSQWEEQVHRELLMQGARDKINNEEIARQKLEKAALKTEIDDKLAAGETFEDLARQYSDLADSAPKGGDLGVLGRGLFTGPGASESQLKQVETLFAAEVGKPTEWIEVETGFQKFLVYEKKEAEGEDYDKAKADLISQLKAEKAGESGYEPSETEIAERYETVSARVIQLTTGGGTKAQDELQKWTKEARIEVNNPYALAYAAVTDPKLNPPEGIDLEGFKTIAAKAALGENYDYSFLAGKYNAGRRTEDMESAQGETAEAAGEVAEGADADSADSTDAAAAPPAAEAAAGSSTELESIDIPQISIDAEGNATSTGADEGLSLINLASTPVYALAIGLLETALEDEPSGQASFARFMIAKYYTDWLKDDENIKLMSIDRAKARAEIEKQLALYVKSDNYNPLAYAMRGENLAWMGEGAGAGNKEQAYAQLALAMKYAPPQDGPIWTQIKDAYDVFDDQAKVDEVDAKLAEFRQAQLAEALKQAQQQAAQEAPPADDPNTEASSGADAAGAGATAEPPDAESAGDAEPEASGGE